MFTLKIDNLYAFYPAMTAWGERELDAGTRRLFRHPVPRSMKTGHH